MRIVGNTSRLQKAWDVVALGLIVASCLMVSHQVAFSHKVDRSGSIAVYLIDLFFLSRIFLTFRAGYQRRGVARAVDIFASVPFDALLLGSSDVTAMGVSVVLLLRLLRLLRVGQLFSIFRRWEAQSWTNSGVLRIGKFSLVAVLLLHGIACAWFLVAYVDEFPVDSWVEVAGIRDASADTQYIRSLYWAIVTMTTVGYGDITPARNIEYVFTMIVMLLGATTYAFIIGNIASLFSSLDSAKASFWSRVEAVNQYLRARNVSPELNDQVRGYYDYLWARYRGMNERDLLHDLPVPVRVDVLLQLTKDLIEKVPLFRNCTPALRNILVMALKPQICTPGAYIVREGEVGDEIYFLSSGRMEIVSDDADEPHGTLEPGDHFGDLSLLLRERRTASVRALTYCDLFILERSDFERIKSQYPEFRDILKKVSSDRSDKVSDLVLEGVIL